MPDTKTTERPFLSLQAKTSLGTKDVLDECVNLIGKDDLGRTTPSYAVLHQALVAFRDSLKEAKDKK